MTQKEVRDILALYMHNNRTYDCAEKLQKVVVPLRRHKTVKKGLEKWKQKYLQQSKQAQGYKKLLKDLKELER